jgi:hypothetical protein
VINRWNSVATFDVDTARGTNNLASQGHCIPQPRTASVAAGVSSGEHRPPDAPAPRCSDPISRSPESL